MNNDPSISRRAYQKLDLAYSWEEIFEAGPYYERVSDLLEDAQHYAIFVGWQIDSRLPLPRPERPGKPGGIESLKEKILRIVESKPGFHFYFLMWDHAYFYVLERESWQGRIWDNLHPRVHFLFDNRHPFGGSHHEKICIIDGTTAFCGGIDLCDDRWDTPQHLYTDPRRSLTWQSEAHGPYHDVAVQVTGPVCATIQHHVEGRWLSLSSIPFPTPAAFPLTRRSTGAGHEVYVSRTIAEIEASLHGSVIREIEFLFRDLIHSAKKRIILEGQYYWSDEINDMLISKIRSMAGKDFEIFLILADLHSLKALTSQLSLYELRLLESLQSTARAAGVKLTIGFPHVHPFAAAKPSKPIYIHSKVIVIDDRFLSIGSANLASRALRLDTELSLTLEARNEAEHAHIRRFADFVLKHWNLVSKESGNSDVFLHLVDAAEEVQRKQAQMSLLENLIQRYVPWKTFFDPKIPWFHPIDRRFRRLANSKFPWMVLLTATLWIISSIASLALSSSFAPIDPSRWDKLYALVLTSAWFAPVPFTGVAILSLFQLGFQKGAAISLSSLWVSVLLGYGLTRAFPSYLTGFYRASGPSWLPKRLMLRQFPATISVALDPFVMLRSKIAYQGLYCVPIPWFALNMLVVLPSALYFLLFMIHQFVGRQTGLEISQQIAREAPALFMALSAFATARLAASVFRKGQKVEKKAS